MSRLVIRHFDPADIERRLDLMGDAAFQRNLAHYATTTTREDMRAGLRDLIEHSQDTRMSFVIETRSGETVGFTWITSIDWVSRACELSVAVLPRHRHGHGLLALVEMYDFLYEEMNFATVVNQVLVGNDMLLSDDLLARRGQVRCRFDSFTQGAFRDAVYWAQTRAEHLALVRNAGERNARIRARISARGRVPETASVR